MHRFSTSIQIKYFVNICPMGAELFHADGWADGWADGPTDVTQIMVTFSPPSIFYIKSTEWPKINTTKTQKHPHLHTYIHSYIHI